MGLMYYNTTKFEKCLEIGMTASWVLSDEQCEIRFGKGKLKRKPDKSSDALKEEVSAKSRYTTIYLKPEKLTIISIYIIYAYFFDIRLFSYFVLILFLSLIDTMEIYRNKIKIENNEIIE